MKNEILRDFVHYEVRESDNPYGPSFEDRQYKAHQHFSYQDAKDVILERVAGGKGKLNDYIIVRVEHRKVITNE